LKQSKSLKELNTEWLEKRPTDPAVPAVLIADDSESDIFFLMRAFATARVNNPVHVVRGGADAIKYLAGGGKFADRSKYPMPRIVFVDLKMPQPDGFEVLRWKEEQRLAGILWVATSNFDGVRTINDAYQAGATTFLTKPLEARDVRNLIEAFGEFDIAKRRRHTVTADN
jgi:CheY-like chemotaxis protein